MKKYLENIRTRSDEQKHNIAKILALVATGIIVATYIILRIIFAPTQTQEKSNIGIIEGSSTIFQEGLDQLTEAKNQGVIGENSALNNIFNTQDTVNSQYFENPLLNGVGQETDYNITAEENTQDSSVETADSFNATYDESDPYASNIEPEATNLTQ